jgi:hypothetical protein
MIRRALFAAAVLLAAAAVLPAGLRRLAAGQAPSFDKLSDQDRKALGERFKRDLWPLLERGGKDGCVGCHRDGKIVSALHMTGDADRDFRVLLREGFLLKDDAGSLLARIEETDRRRRMPPGKVPSWAEAEKKTLRDFVEAIDKKQRR